MNIILTDHQERDHLLPLTYTRPVAKLRVGLFTIEEKWQRMAADATISFKAQDYMSKVFPEKDADDNLYVNGAAIPTIELIQELIGLADGESLYQGEAWIATRSASKLTEMPASGSELNAEVKIISRSWRIFQWNGEEITSDLALVRNNGSSAAVPDGVTLIGDDIFIEEGATLRPCTINTETGPVYIGKNAEVMEGSLVRGPFALMNDSVLKMGAKIYGATTIGPHSKVGVEVNNCVIFGYSNKAHDGFIGNSVIGEWCNLGADTNTSNLKNNYAVVKVHNYALNRSESTESQFCGLMMADHAKAGINTMFNTGTVCGVFANAFGAGFPHRRIPDFGWGGAEGFKSYRLNDALEVARIVMSRRSIELTDDIRDMYTHVHELVSAES